jgi:hypothetical protein
MAEPTKEVLFTFKTMRMPELISEENKANFFISHFDEATGVFLEAFDGMEPEENREDVLATAASGFVDLKTQAELMAIDNNLYLLGLFLIQNRSSITVAQATAEVGSLTPLSAPNLELVWDNLFYQTITLQSGYAREVCLVLLLANHFVDNFSSIPATDDDMRKWASSKVILPFKLFGFDTSFSSATTENEMATGDLALSNAMDVATSALQLEMLEALKTEMEEYKTLFYKTNNALENEALNDHLAAVKTALGEATSATFVDQFSEFSFEKYTDYEAPAYSYVRPQEVDMDPIGSYLAPNSLHVMLANRINTASSFQEFDKLLDDAIQAHTRSVFEKTNFQEEKIIIDGNLISKCGIEQRFKKKNRYLVQLVEKTTNNYLIYLTADVGSSCLQVSSAATTATVPPDNNIVTNKSKNVGGIITIDLTAGVPIDMTEEEEGVTISTVLEMNNGMQFSFTGIVLMPGLVSPGILTAATFETTDEIEIPSGYGLRRLGVGDYRKVEQTLCCYVPGEVSHIENLMAREYKERSTRRLRRQEDTTTSSSSSEAERMTDTSTTSRFDIQKEISTVLSLSNEFNQSNSFSASADAGGSLFGVTLGGTISTDNSSDFSVSSSLEQSNSESVNFAKDVTEKAMQRMVSKVSEERVNKIIEEFEEKNQHGFDNRKGAEHISGVYRWVDKIYKNQIFNYGRRLHYEFMIPEPAEFHLIAKANAGNSNLSVPLIKPLDPRTNSFGLLTPLKHAYNITVDNYYQWAAIYGATVLPPPEAHLVFAKSIVKPDDGAAWYIPKTVKDEVKIPTGYGVDAIHISIAATNYPGNPVLDWPYSDMSACGISKRYYGQEWHKYWFADADHFPEIRYVDTTVPIGSTFFGFGSAISTFTVRVTRKPSLLREWQLDTFNAIISAYNDRLEEYKNTIAEAEAKRLSLMKDNPAFYRQIENTVLKKACISYLTGHSYMGQDFTVGLEITNNQVKRTAAMDKYASSVKFFEQAFDWHLMDYTFYPFYWANKENWEKLYNTQNEDALFKSFLTAGMAKCIVTVRPGFEAAVLYFMQTGVIWNGGEVPIIDDPMNVATMFALMKEEQTYTIEETWETRVPSTLTVIQAKTVALQTEGLPCFCDDELTDEEIVSPEVNPLTGLDVFIEGDTGE